MIIGGDPSPLFLSLSPQNIIRVDTSRRDYSILRRSRIRTFSTRKRMYIQALANCLHTKQRKSRKFAFRSFDLRNLSTSSSINATKETTCAQGLFKNLHSSEIVCHSNIESSSANQFFTQLTLLIAAEQLGNFVPDTISQCVY